MNIFLCKRHFLSVLLLLSMTATLLQSCSRENIASPGSETSGVESGSPAYWIITPVVYFEFNETCLGEEQGMLNGYKYVNAYFVVENGTPSFGEMPLINHRAITITTQEGYSYPHQNNYGIAAGDPSTLIPPGFRIRGDLPAIASSDIEGGNRLEFKVANDTSGYTINIPGYAPISLSNVPSYLSDDDLIILSGGANDRNILWGSEGENCVSNGNSINIFSSLPTEQPDSMFYDIGQTISINEDIDMMVSGFSREGTHLSLDIYYVNKSGAYEKSIRNRLYVIGNDGFIRNTDPTNSFDLGPKQETDRNYTFYVPETLSNIKLVITFWEENFVDPNTVVVNVK